MAFRSFQVSSAGVESGPDFDCPPHRGISPDPCRAPPGGDVPGGAPGAATRSGFARHAKCCCSGHGSRGGARTGPVARGCLTRWWLLGSDHVFRADDLVERGPVHEAQIDGLLAQSRSILVRGFGDGGGVVVSDGGRQGCDQHQAFAHQLFDPTLVRFDSGHAIVGEGRRRVTQKLYGLQDVVCHHGFVDVEFEVALGARESDGGVVSENMRADLRQRLALSWIDLAGHDRRPGLVLRQHEFAEAAAGAGPEQADVVGDFEQRRGDCL